MVLATSCLKKCLGFRVLAKNMLFAMFRWPHQWYAHCGSGNYIHSLSFAKCADSLMYTLDFIN